MTQNYSESFHQYPLFADELSIEGAVKRYSTMPTPKDVYDEALRGIPKVYPLTNEPIPIDIAESFLASAITHIEADLGCNLSPVVRYMPVDYVTGMFDSNYSGTILPQWPATEIIQVSIKFPHTITSNPYQTYVIPAGWVSLRKNKMNIVAAVGAVSSTTSNNGFVSTGGLVSFYNNFVYGNWQPNVLEVVYKSGFEEGKLPSFVADLIKVWAAKYLLEDLLPIIAPTNSTTVSIDGVSQTASLALPQLLGNRIQGLDKKKMELSNAFKKLFGVSVNATFIGA